MITLIEYLTAIREYAKDIHYNAHGEAFYGIHLLMDRIADGIYDKIDAIKETYYLGNIQQPPKSADILKVTMAYIPEVTASNDTNLRNLDALIAKTLDHIKLNFQNEERATNTLLDDIAQDLTLKRGLIWRSLEDI